MELEFAAFYSSRKLKKDEVGDVVNQILEEEFPSYTINEKALDGCYDDLMELYPDDGELGPVWYPPGAMVENGYMHLYIWDEIPGDELDVVIRNISDVTLRHSMYLYDLISGRVVSGPGIDFDFETKVLDEVQEPDREFVRKKIYGEGSKYKFTLKEKFQIAIKVIKKLGLKEWLQLIFWVFVLLLSVVLIIFVLWLKLGGKEVLF